MGFLDILLSPQCYDELFINLNILHVGCVQLLISKLVGYTIVLLTSVFMKLPQVLKILHSRSTEGISLLSQILMLTTCSTTISYSIAKDFPVSTWGESMALGLQTLSIILLILVYDDRPTTAVIFTVVYFLVMLVILSPSVPVRVHVGLQFIALPLNFLSKGAQILLNFRQSGTGQLSATSIFLMNFRSFGRLYTNLTETKDVLRVVNFSVQCVMNSILVAQVFYYRGVSKLRAKLKKG